DEDVEDSEEELLAQEQHPPPPPPRTDRVPLPRPVNHARRHLPEGAGGQAASSPSSEGSLSPEGPDSTTSGSFMLDDVSPYTDSMFGVMPFFSNALAPQNGNSNGPPTPTAPANGEANQYNHSANTRLHNATAADGSSNHLERIPEDSC